jgi:hypothetical protein
VLLAVKEEEAPPQIAAGVAVGEMTGLGLTVTVTVADPVQPAAVPVTAYVVVVAGVTETVEPVKPPGFHIKVVPPTVLFADNEEEPTLHIVVGVAIAVIAGYGFTAIVKKAWVPHCPTNGSNVYVVVALLFKAGDHVPEIEGTFVEVVGSGTNAFPIQIGPTGLKVVVTFGIIVIVIVALVAQYPADGVKV